VRDLHQEIVFGVAGQSLVWDCPEGRPTAVTSVNVYRADQDDTGPAEFTPAGTIEATPDTTITAAAGADQSNPRAIALTVADGIVRDRQYLIASSATGDTEWFSVDKLAGLSVTTRQPLINSYAIGATVKGTRITAPVDAAWVASVNKLSPEESPHPWYRAVLVYTVGGVVYRSQNFVDLVRYTTKHTVTPIDVDGVKAGWLDELPVDYRREQGRQLIAEAFRAVRLDMLTDGKAFRWLRHLDVVNELVAYRAVERAAAVRVANFGVGFNASYQLALDAYERRYRQLIREPKVPLLATPGGSAGEAVRLPLTRR
jgi:hypothetical protein